MTHRERFLGVNHYAPASIGCPSMIYDVNTDVFEKCKAERELVKEFKKLMPKSRGHKFVTAAKIAF